MLLEAVGRLSARERQIMELRFGLFGRGGAYAEGSGGYDRHFPKLHSRLEKRIIKRLKGDLERIS